MNTQPDNIATVVVLFFPFLLRVSTYVFKKEILNIRIDSSRFKIYEMVRNPFSNDRTHKKATACDADDLFCVHTRVRPTP